MTYDEHESHEPRGRRGRGPRGERRGGGHGRPHHHGPDQGFNPDQDDRVPAPGFGFGGFPMPPAPPFGGPHPGGHKGFGRRGRRAGRGDVRMAVLHLLGEQPRNGYQIIQELAERTDGLWKPSPGAIYPAMSALEDEGLIVPDADNPKVFTLTDAGRDAVAASPEAPWASFQDAGRDFRASEHGTLWKEFGKLADALRAVATNATGDQVSAAADILARTRRDLFSLLATEPAGSAEASEPVTDTDDIS
ncbi:PadR family transcriptional regulator [Aestuariimicrobium sp. Y1814]|uniref:PadR family transcriptional regulator n=1 Tax=Aestuariimicrobium sp. Y1814 TaxID=3418742 RepID=UPI003DA7238D